MDSVSKTGAPTLICIPTSTLLSLYPQERLPVANACVLSAFRLVTMPSDSSLMMLVRVKLVCATADLANANSPELAARPGTNATARVVKPGRPEGRKRDGKQLPPAGGGGRSGGGIHLLARHGRRGPWRVCRERNSPNGGQWMRLGSNSSRGRLRAIKPPLQLAGT